MILTRDEILDAIDEITKPYNLTAPFFGLCAAFKWCKPFRAYLSEIGGAENRSEYFWPNTHQGRQQRLMFLAFLLTWHDDITGYKE